MGVAHCISGNKRHANHEPQQRFPPTCSPGHRPAVAVLRRPGGRDRVLHARAHLGCRPHGLPGLVQRPDLGHHDQQPRRVHEHRQRRQHLLAPDHQLHGERCLPERQLRFPDRARRRFRRRAVPERQPCRHRHHRHVVGAGLVAHQRAADGFGPDQLHGQPRAAGLLGRRLLLGPAERALHHQQRCHLPGHERGQPGPPGGAGTGFAGHRRPWPGGLRRRPPPRALSRRPGRR